jgi:formylglycine-generating enzyme required for sulfatase activity
MPKIFISYRREDSQLQADLLHAALRKHVAYPRRDIFFNTSEIAIGLDVVQYVDAQVADCDMLLAFIGPNWLSAAHPRTGRRRLDDPKDVVRIEIASALRRGITVVPVLVEGAAMPAEGELPNDLKPLAKLTGVDVRPASFEADAEQMILGLHLTEIGLEPKARLLPPAPDFKLPDLDARWIAPLVALGILVVVAGGGAWAWLANSGDGRDGGRGSAAHSASAPSLASSTGSPSTGHPTATASTTAPSPSGITTDPEAAKETKADDRSLALRDEAVWKITKDAATLAPFVTYLQDFPQGLHASEAREHISLLTAAALVPGAGVLAPGRRPRAGEVFRDCADCPELVALPAASFVMGSPLLEPGRNEDEGPPRPVDVRAFAAGKYEVMASEWQGCVAAHVCAKTSSEGSGDTRRPITYISWNDAKTYAAWLSRKTGRNYRLLSEAEWEYAARGGTSSPYPWGEMASHDRANFGTDQCCEGAAAERDRWVGTAPVGSFPANAFGLFDMHGNVWEWVEDCYESSYSAGQPDDGSAFEKSPCVSRVSRGGSWSSDPRFLRSAVRDFIVPTSRGGGLGFRVARTL